jgi:cytochrome c55X
MMRFFWLIGLLSLSVRAENISPQRQQELLNMLKHDCGSCHGLPPKGGLGPSLLPDDLAGKSDAVLFDAIQNGRSGTAMPAWKPFLSIDETVWMITQLRQGLVR